MKGSVNGPFTKGQVDGPQDIPGHPRAPGRWFAGPHLSPSRRRRGQDHPLTLAMRPVRRRPPAPTAGSDNVTRRQQDRSQESEEG